MPNVLEYSSNISHSVDIDFRPKGGSMFLRCTIVTVETYVATTFQRYSAIDDPVPTAVEVRCSRQELHFSEAMLEDVRHPDHSKGDSSKGVAYCTCIPIDKGRKFRRSDRVCVKIKILDEKNVEKFLELIVHTDDLVRQLPPSFMPARTFRKV